MAFHRLFRGFCTKTDVKLRAERLIQRNLILVKGQDSSQFLQGLITNDINHLIRGNTSIYTMFLNKGGRVLYDSIIYNKSTPDEESFLVECDTQVVDQLMKHLKIFRVRRKIDIEKCEKDKVWVVFDGSGHHLPVVKNKTPEALICADPRLKYLGTRVILPDHQKLSNLMEIFKCGLDETQEGYREHRYKLGIGEGVIDFPCEKSFPLEGNVDFLNGVSFHKGCYVGQELTARTHHTGVVRKRLMPLKFMHELKVVDPTDLEVQNEQGQNIGKLRGYCNGFGLGIIRIEPALAAAKIQIKGHDCDEITVEKPKWWPTDQNLKHIR